MTDEEYEVLMDFLISAFPVPERVEGLALEDARVWRQADLQVLSDRFGATGIGFYQSDQVVLAGPTLLTAALGDVSPQIHPPVLVGYYTAFGAVAAILEDGSEVSVDPVTRIAYVVQSNSQPDRLQLVLDFASDFLGALEDADELPIKTVNDQPLLPAAQSQLGQLEYGEVFSFDTAIADGGRPETSNIRRLGLTQALMARVPYQVIVTQPMDAGTVAGDDWAQGLDLD